MELIYDLLNFFHLGSVQDCAEGSRRLHAAKQGGIQWRGREGNPCIAIRPRSVMERRALAGFYRTRKQIYAQ